MGIILAILLFSAIVIFHELGHFLLAKKNKPVRYIIRGIMISGSWTDYFWKTVWRNKIQLKASSVWRSLHDGRR